MKATYTPGISIRLTASEAHKLITDLHASLGRFDSPEDTIDLAITSYAAEPNNAGIWISVYRAPYVPVGPENLCD